MEYTKPEVSRLAAAMAAIQGCKTCGGVNDSAHPYVLPYSTNAYEADE